MSGRRAAGVAVDAAVALAIVSLVYVPFVAHLVGAGFANELFFHWDHFALGPAVAWRSGLALGTEIYSQYGAGLPVLLNAISPWVPLSHQNTIHLAMGWGCLHHVGLYVLLRVAVESRALALGGTLGVLAASVFSPLVASQGNLASIWQWPSLSVMRAPFDVWFFLALLLHARRPTTVRAVAAGALAGLAVFFETDTGVFLVGTFAVYGGCRFVAAELGGSLPRASAPAGATVAAAALALVGVLVAGLTASSLGTIWSDPGAFVSGWIGGVANSSNRGVGSSAFTFFLRDWGGYLVAALAVLGVGLFAVCDTGVRLLQGRATATVVFAGCVGLYALGRSTLFVWRTVPIRLTLAAIPIGILVVLALASLREPAAERLARATGVARRRLEPVVPALALALGAALLLASPTFRAYPNLWNVVRSGPPEAGLVLFPDKGEVAGLPPELRPVVGSIRLVVAEVRALEAPVAVIDPVKTLIYVETGVPPWDGDAALFLNTWTLEDLDALAARLERDGPPHVLFRRVSPSPAVEDTWLALRGALERAYAPAKDLGVFQRWDRVRP